MNEIDNGLILNSITLALREAYPDSQIFVDDVEQDFDPPAFFVSLASFTRLRRHGECWQCSARFDVAYYPQDGTDELIETADGVIDLLSDVTLSTGDMLHGADMDYNIVDGVFHMLVSYKYTACRETAEPELMEMFTLEQGG